MTTAITAMVATAAAAAVAAAISVNDGSVDDDVSDDSSCGGDVDGCGGGAETVMAAVAMAGVKMQQSTSNGSVEGGRCTRAQQRVVMNNKSAWPMMRAETKRAERERATVTRVVGERWQQW
jgi:hypothetical protein